MTDGTMHSSRLIGAANLHVQNKLERHWNNGSCEAIRCPKKIETPTRSLLRIAEWSYFQGVVAERRPRYKAIHANWVLRSAFAGNVGRLGRSGCLLRKPFGLKPGRSHPSPHSRTYACRSLKNTSAAQHRSTTSASRPSERLRLERRPARFPRGSGSGSGRACCRFDLCADLVGPSAPATLSRGVRSLMITSPGR